MKLRGLICGVVGLSMSYATPVFAQEQVQVWLRDRRYGEGIGIRAGDLELHPGLAGEFGYDSNWFLRDEAESPVGALRFRITPSFSISTVSEQRREGEGGTPAPPKVAFRAGVAATYMEFIGVNGANSDDLSKQRNISGMGTLQLTILPRRPLGADVYADVLRSVQPSNDPTFNFNRISGRFGGGVTWAPGGGMFDWRLGYEYGLIYFEDVSFRGLSTDYHQINTRGRWRFLPRTAFLYDATAAFLRYNRAPSPAQLDSNPVRARLGLNGLVTPSFAVLAMAGWGSSFYKGTNAQQYDGIIAQAELKWFITPATSLELTGAALPVSTAAIGYARDFFNSYLGDYFVRDRIYATISHMFAGRFLVVLDGGYAPTRYAPWMTPQRQVGHPGFSAPWLDASIFAEYRFASSFGINTTLRYSGNITDERVQNDYVGWKRFEAYLGLRWFM